MTPFRSEKNTNWEGGWRVPATVRWPGKIEAGSVSNGIMHHMDWFPTFAAIAGNPNIKEQLLKGKKMMGRIFYFSDDGDLTALRYEDWKLIFAEQRAENTLQAWIDPFVPLRVPLIFNLRRDPYERASETSNTYYDWMIDRVYLLVPAQQYVAQFLSTFKEFPPRQKAASFSIDQILETLKTPPTH